MTKTDLEIALDYAKGLITTKDDTNRKLIHKNNSLEQQLKGSKLTDDHKSHILKLLFKEKNILFEVMHRFEPKEVKDKLSGCIISRNFTYYEEGVIGRYDENQELITRIINQ